MKKWFGRWNRYEIGWLLFFCAVAAAIALFSGDSPFGFTVFLSGVLCVILAAKGNILNYAVGMYNTFGYALLAFQNGLYGEMGLNLFFYVPMNILGFILWRKHTGANATVTMRALSPTRTTLVAVLCAAGIAGMGFALSLIPGQNSPYIDATTNILSVAATLLMVRRFREQWLAYIVLNVFTVVLWTLRAANGSEQGLMMIVMWSAYLVNAVYGWIVWSRGAREGGAAA